MHSQLFSNSKKCAARAIFLVIMLSILGNAHANDLYSQGLQAYIDKDFQTAQTFWLSAAKKGDAKSMFNLGLLHEQSKVKNADIKKAYEWYQLAGDRGYAPADYHYAIKLLERGDRDMANTLFRRAADRGYAPAMAKLGRGGSNKTVQRADSSGFQTEAWINTKKSTYWTIQMLAFKEEKKVQGFINDHQLQSKAAYFVERSGGNVLYKLVYGAYKTKIQADFARQNLPSELKKHGPWLRSMESVQKIIKAQ